MKDLTLPLVRVGVSDTSNPSRGSRLASEPFASSPMPEVSDEV